MDNQLDDELKNRIREVFENFEDPSAEEGWLLLREKFPEKAKRRPVAWLWWSSAAAVLLLFLGVWWLNYSDTEKKPTFAVVKKQPVIPQASKAVAPGKEPFLADSAASHQRGQSFARSEAPVNHTAAGSTGKVNTGQPAVTLKNQNTNTTGTENTLAANPTANPLTQHGADNSSNVLAAQPHPVLKTDSGNLSSAQTMTAATKPAVAAVQAPPRPNTLAFADKGAQAVKIRKSPGERTIRLGAYATTYVNYARGSNNPLNLGGGVTADIRLSSRFRLSTGVSIVQNKLNFSYDNQLPAPSATANYLALASNNVYSTNSAFAEPAPVLKNYNATLLGLDIPLNIKFMFNPRKSDTYISAGLSSGTFINEKYNYQYNSSSLLSPGQVQTHGLSTRNDFSGFYFAKTLNFAFGTSANFGGHRVIIEPFVKYPLDGLGSQQLRFGSSGVNLKFNIQSHK